MKLRHLILLLLISPLLCELVTVGLLASSFWSFEQNAAKESIAKRVVTVTEEINGLLAQEMLEATGTTLFEQRKNPERKKDTKAELSLKIDELEGLVRDDADVTPTVERYKRNCIRFVDNWEDLVAGFKFGQGKLYLSQFEDKNEYAESMKALFDELKKDTITLLKKYGGVAREFEPRAVQRRNDLHNIVYFTVLSTALIIFAIYMVLSRKTLARLSVLMNNIARFSRDEKNLEVVQGKDELAELDKAFREMFEQKSRLEDVRKAMRAMVNHDLRSPLTSINIRLDLLIDKYRGRTDPEVYRHLERMRGESQRLARLANTLLDVEKLEEGHIDLKKLEVTPHDLIEPAYDSIAALADRKEITIIRELDPDLTLLCDEDRTIQVMVNLLSNAIKFAPEKSTITIQVIQTPDGAVRFSVKDQGTGVPKDKVAGLFSKFHQLDQPADTKKEGSGLGLYICKMLVQTQGGTIGYEDGVDGGAVFWFMLPGLPTE